MWKSILAITLGAAIGAVVRWRLGLTFDSLFPTVPLGTLAANLIGGYFVGIFIAYFAYIPNVAPDAGSLVMTLAGLASGRLVLV